MPRFIGKSPVGLLMNKSAYHNQHHRTYRYNYGLYTVIWDRLFGTFHPKAEQLYDEKSDFSRIAAAAKDDHSPSCPGSSSPR